LPWWVVLLVTCYLLLKVGLSLEHPCSVLGVWAPVTRGQISKRYREISMCTHPDKLLGHTADEVERGKLLFQRASEARDGLIAATRESAAAIERAAKADAIDGGQADGDGTAVQAEASCSTQLDEAIYQGLSYLVESSHEVGAYAMLAYVYDFFYRLLTFEFDVTGTISSVLLLMTLYRTLAGFFSFLRDSGPLSTLVAAVTTCVLGPLPTLLRFIALPLLRVEAFVRGELLPFVANTADDAADNDVEIEGGLERNARMAEAEAAVLAQVEAEGTATEGGRAAAASGEAGAEAEGQPDGTTAEMRAARRKLPQKRGEAQPPMRGLKQRAKAAVTQGVRQPTKAELHARFALRRMREAMEETFLTPVALQPMRTLLARRADPNARAYAASVVQFELLLSTSKPIIPLCCLLATGQVFNGIFFSIATAQVLHRLPALRAETQHLLVLLVGAVHTLVCAGKSQLMELEKAPEGLLQLQWTWGMRDVFAIANMLLIGASFSTAAATFNEPPFCASFAAGLALRIAIYEVCPPWLGEGLRRLMRSQNLEYVGLDQVAARAVGRIGSCGGGPVRAALGGWGVGWLPHVAAIGCKATILVIPLLAAAQWGVRAATAWKRLRREGARQGEKVRRIKMSNELLVPVLRRRCAAAVVMHVCMLLLVGLVTQYELNGLNSELGTFLVLACAGCLFESLLSSYDLRGRVRQFIFFVMFMVV